MELPNDLRHFKAPDAFDIFDDNEKAIIAVALIALILFCNWKGWL